jgi:Tol biopolymer transport system component
MRIRRFAVNGRALIRPCASAALLFVLLAAGCSKSQTSPAVLCDNEGDDLIAFSSDRGHAGLYDIYLFDADLAGFRLLRGLEGAAGSDSSPSLSRDGQLIAFVSDRGGPGNTDLYIYERISCSLIATTGLNTPGNETEPTFSGDTRRLAFVRDTLGQRRIRLVNGGSLTYVPLPGLDAPSGYSDWSPAPDSTGQRIAFLSDREGDPQLYLYDRVAQKVDSLKDLRVEGARDRDPSLTPDARYLCFASDRSGGQGGFDLYIVDLTSAPRSFESLPNLNTAGDERHPRISHSGSYIAFQSQSADSTGWNVRYYSRAGSLVVMLPQLAGTGTDIQPSIRLP